MATITGTHVNFVKVPSMAKFNDITTKADGTIYFIVDEKKIHLDGVMYGFNDSDIDLTPFLKHDGTIPMSGRLRLNNHHLQDFVGWQGNNSQAAFTPTGVYLEYGAVDDEGDHMYSLDLKDGNIILFGGSVRGLHYINIAGSDALDAFEEMDPTHAVPYGTLQTLKGTNYGFAELDGTGKVPSYQLPSFVDDVIEVNNYASLPTTGEKGKLYVTIDNNHLYRWSGSAWVNVSDGNAHLILGTTSSTAYRGDHGLIAYNHRTTTNNPHSVTKAQVGLGNVVDQGLATKGEAEAGSSNAKYMTPLRTKEAIETLAPKLAWTVVA